MKFTLACPSDNLGHITIAAELIDDDASESWSAKFNLATEAEQLEKIANNMKTWLQG